MKTSLRILSALLTTIALVLVWVGFGIAFTDAGVRIPSLFGYAIIGAFLLGIIATWARAIRPSLSRFITWCTWVPWLFIASYGVAFLIKTYA